ncbi:MAG: hypothetical protein E6Q58_04785 [Niabella sp.]|nr:MAG: hypothetical protein E6Q58_04785 [Niabella sp.]
MSSNKDTLAKNIVEQIKKLEDSKLIKKIAEELLSSVNKPEAIIKYASDMNQSEKSKIEKMITERFGKIEKFNYVKDESLIGGFRVEYGEFFIDKSIKNSLNQLKSKIN